MGGFIRRSDPWALAAFVVWVVLLLMGLLPEWTFASLRDVSGVVTQQALVNNPMAITVGFALYIGLFTWWRCRESSQPVARAQATAVQMGLVAFVAFLPMRAEDLYLAAASPDAGLRVQLMAIIWSLGIAKTAAWFYILSLLFRYYVLHRYRVFADIPSLFPSGGRRNEAGYENTDSVYDSSAE